jgi:hypothetical protein
VGESYDEDEGRKDTQESFQRRRSVARPRRWIVAVDRDAKRMLKRKNWRRSAEDRDV